MGTQNIIERLDFVAKRIPGLKFTKLQSTKPKTGEAKPGDPKSGDTKSSDPKSNDTIDDLNCFMSCDMYYIEIKLGKVDLSDQSEQMVKEVVITHTSNNVMISCPVLKKVLEEQDFETFAKHLSGIHSIYQIKTNDIKVKSRAYPALTALETDLKILHEHQRRRTNNCYDLIHKSPLGIMEPRNGGLPVRLTYFVTPYDLVDVTRKELINLTPENIIDKTLGLSATVEIQGSSPSHKLQVTSLISRQLNSDLPAYSPFNSQNSEKLPAQFVLKLSQPFPMLNTSINQIINEINEPSTIKEYLTTITTTSKESLVSLIARQELEANNKKGSFTSRSLDALKCSDSDSSDSTKHVYTIKLMEQHHTYYIFDNYLDRQDGVYVNEIPFTHPTSIPNILRVLRQQALFNFIIGSCVRRGKNTNSNTFDENAPKIPQESNIFDVIPINLNNICVSFEHPSKESLATLEIDLKEMSCQLYAFDKESVCSDEFATRVLHKCWSIPITLRSVLKKCNDRRLALLEDANKRRERELQELLANNSTQQSLNYKPHLQYQETLLQSKFNSIHEKSKSRDLNNIAEFLNSKINHAGTSDASNQTNTNTDSASRSNLLKKYSCKPKVKQTSTAKNPPGNPPKILSLMLKRQNSTSSSLDDTSLKATLTKKAKIKVIPGDQHTKNVGLTTTKLISPEIANAARLASKQAKQGTNNQNVSVSLIRSPNKTSPFSATSASVGVNFASQGLSSNNRQSDSSAFDASNSNSSRIKSQSNGGNNMGKPRKSSIGVVIDKLVDGVTPEQNMSLQQSPSNENLDSSKGSPLGSKSKPRTPADQFAIKQGSLGGLKLTVTKTKPAITPAAASASSSSASTSTPNSTSMTTISSTSSTTNNHSTTKLEASKNMNSGLGASIKYTIPKISKFQQPSQSNSNQNNSTDDRNSATNNPNLNADDSNNPSSSASNTSSAPSSTTNKRTTPSPFNRTNNNNNNNRNSVSSSTPHPRTTSNPLAVVGRPSSTSSNESHSINRTSGGNQNQGMRLLNNRMVNIQQQQQVQQQVIQRLANPNIIAPQPVINQPLMFALNMPQTRPQVQFSNTMNNVNRLPLTSANDNLMNRIANCYPPNVRQQITPGIVNSQLQQLQMQQQQQQLQQLQQQQPQQHQQQQLPQQQHLQLQKNQQQSEVSSSSDSGNQGFEPTISTPSSPTECGQTETVPPPPLIPIDSLEEHQSASPDCDHPDDASDRLSIVDANDSVADSNSVAGTPKPSMNSPPTAQDPNSATSSTSSRNMDSSIVLGDQ